MLTFRLAEKELIETLAPEKNQELSTGNDKEKRNSERRARRGI